MKKSVDEVVGDFIDSFEAHHTLYSSGHRVSLDEFLHYYSFASALVDTDGEFQQLIRTSWSL